MSDAHAAPAVMQINSRRGSNAAIQMNGTAHGEDPSSVLAMQVCPHACLAVAPATGRIKLAASLIHFGHGVYIRAVCCSFSFKHVHADHVQLSCC